MIATIMTKYTTIRFLLFLVLLLLLSITADLFNNGGRISTGVIGVAASSDEEEVSSAAASLIAAGIINKPGTVIDLTPELYKKLLSINNKGYDFSRFFIKINTKKCLLRPDLDNVCDIISDVVWKPLAQMYPNEIFTQLDCHMYQGLCFDITSQKYVQVLEGISPFDLMMIESSESSSPSSSESDPRRAVEFYRGKRDLQSSIDYYSEIILRNEPLLPSTTTFNDNDNGNDDNDDNDDFPTGVSSKDEGAEKRSKKQKLVVLVLSTDGFIRPDVWSQFVGVTNTTDTNVVDVQVYVHDKNNRINTIENNNIPDFCHIVPTVYTNRLTISIIRAAIQLLRYAMHHQNSNSSTSTTKDGNNSNDAESDKDTHYILVSGDSIPLLSAQDTVNDLIRTKTKNDESESKSSKSRFEKYPDDEQHTPYIFRYGTNVDNPNVGYGTGDIQMGGGFAQPATNYGYAKVFRSKSWFSMTHKDAVWFANPRNDETSNFEMMITSDEYYSATLANEYYNNNNNQNQIQGPGQFEHNLPFMYESIDINPDKSSPGILDYVDDTIYKKSGHLFARTITSETQVVLSWLNNINYNNNNNGGGGGGGNSNSNSNDATISSMTKVDLSHTGEIIFNEQLVNFQQQKNKTSQS